MRIARPPAPLEASLTQLQNTEFRPLMGLAALAAVSFVLHLVWERLHISLYTGYDALEGVLPVYVLATLGDVLYTLLIAALLILIFGQQGLGEPGIRTYVFAAVLGLVVAIFVELKAQMLGRWHYTDAMPTIHGLGLSPVLQMTLLTPLSIFIVTRIEKWLHSDI